MDFYNFHATGNKNEYSIITYSLLT